MSAAEILEQFRRLPEKEQREVADRILDEFGEDGLSPQQIKEAERRADELSRNPENGIKWEQICEELPGRLKNRKCAAK